MTAQSDERPPCGLWRNTYSAHVDGRCPLPEHPAGPNWAQAPVPYPMAGAQPVPVSARPGNSPAVASLVLGILSVVFSWRVLVTLVMVVLAVTFGGAGMRRADVRAGTGKGMAVAGLVLGIAGFCFYFVLGVASAGLGFFALTRSRCSGACNVRHHPGRLVRENRLRCFEWNQPGRALGAGLQRLDPLRLAGIDIVIFARPVLASNRPASILSCLMATVAWWLGRVRAG